jgi:hypothetical protein
MLCLGGKGIFSSGRRWRWVVSNWGWGWNLEGIERERGAGREDLFFRPPPAARRPPLALGGFELGVEGTEREKKDSSPIAGYAEIFGNKGACPQNLGGPIS